ncbi:hypothetical protein RIF29_18694 [Crotalaria pallida]|uniref:Uncharacterized protein n=1 Tax=Crotalaria pallida TaxID=3830 RepID=A0AAN9F2M5_CROPI
MYSNVIGFELTHFKLNLNKSKFVRRAKEVCGGWDRMDQGHVEDMGGCDYGGFGWVLRHRERKGSGVAMEVEGWRLRDGRRMRLEGGKKV